MATICVDGTKVSIFSPMAILTKTSGTIHAKTQSKFSANGKHVLLKKDFQDWLKTFKSEYIFPPWVIPGKVKGLKIILLAPLSLKTKVDGKPVVIKSSMGMAMLSVIKPAQIPFPPVPDPIMMKIAMIKITAPEQTIASSL